MAEAETNHQENSNLSFSKKVWIYRCHHCIYRCFHFTDKNMAKRIASDSCRRFGCNLFSWVRRHFEKIFALAFQIKCCCFCYIQHPFIYCIFLVRRSASSTAGGAIVRYLTGNNSKCKGAIESKCVRK